MILFYNIDFLFNISFNYIFVAYSLLVITIRRTHEIKKFLLYVFLFGLQSLFSQEISTQSTPQLVAFSNESIPVSKNMHEIENSL